MLRQISRHTLALVVSLVGCSSGGPPDPSSQGGDLSSESAAGDLSSGGAVGDLGLGGAVDDLSSGGGADLSVGGGVTPIPDGGCVGLQCAINYNCPVALGATTLTGTVTIPAGTLPINNAIVYIPSGAAPAAPASGPTCSRCAQVVPPDAAASTTTDINGNFQLSFVPSGINVPLVISVGKWQRVVTIPSISDCTTTALAADQTRLPRNQSEGNIPKLALSTGGADALECLLRTKKLGIDDAEFTPESGTGRINLYAGAGGTNSYTASLNGGAAFTGASSFWSSQTNWNKYDAVLLSCEGGQNVGAKNAAAHAASQNYLNAGGRIFASHWQNIWISGAPAPMNTVATFLPTNGYNNDVSIINATINQTFAKGQQLAQWLQTPAVAGTTTLGQLPIKHSRVTLTGLNAGLTTDWADFTDPNAISDGVMAPASQYFSFNTPVGATLANQCGQMVFTDMHVSGAASAGATVDYSATTLPFPTGCKSAVLSPQEKALIFLLFDLTSCLQPT